MPSEVEAANAEAMRRILGAEPYLVGVARAGDVVPGLRPGLFLHAGPPVRWDGACGPLRGAAIGAALLEGVAGTADEAERLLAAGEIRLEPCHQHSAVGPMAGLLSPSMPVWIVVNRAFGNRAYCSLNEGLGRVLRFGAYDDAVLARLRWMCDELAPALGAALDRCGGIDLKSLFGQALHMGDEGHNRIRAATSLLLRWLAPDLVRVVQGQQAENVMQFLKENDHTALNLSMAACKAALDPVAGLPACTVVSAMARNGTDFGIRVAALGDRWFTAPSPVPDGLYFPGHDASDANPDLGDSTITETAGLGAFAMANAPAIVGFVGGTSAAAIETTLEMYEITLAEHPAYTVPALDFRGTPTGIDIRKVVATGITPRVNTGIASRRAGVGQIGAGMVQAPLACFVAAARAVAETLG